MPRPKKADKQRKEDLLPDLRQDREEFLRSFEKPTQIYRFLRARHCISPVFLHRSLLYMLKRCSRTHARRQKFKVNDLLERSISKQPVCKPNGRTQYDQLKILVAGFYIDPGVKTENYVQKKFSNLETQVSVCKMYRSRRKDGESAKTEEIIGTTDTPLNPRNVDAYEEDPLYLNTTDMFSTNDGHNVKNYTLVFRVYETVDEESESESEMSESDDNSDSNWSDGDRKRKRKEDDPAGISLRNLTTGTRRRRTINEDKEDDSDEDGEQTEFTRKNKKSNSDRLGQPSGNAIFEAELAFFNSDKQLLLLEGEYELAMTRKDVKSTNKVNASWESIDGGREIELLSSMNNAPLLKFKLVWSVNDRPGPLALGENGEQENSLGEPETKRMRRRNSIKTNGITEAKDASHSPAPPHPVDLVEYRKVKLNRGVKSKEGVPAGEGGNGNSRQRVVFYQFIYNSETQQQTEAREDLFCPWCQLNCITLYGLIKHLKLCHPRFNFTYVPHQEGSCIEVSVNECYDGSYCGNPQFLFAQPGMAFGRRGPVHRIQVTDTLVYRPRRERTNNDLDLAELLEKEENDASPTAQYSAGHHRLYFHSRNAVPIRPCEFEHDSEDELDPDWLRAYTKRMLDEFTDVNEGEKPIMKLWNLFIMKNVCIADTQLPDACHAFIDSHTPLIVRHSLRRNLLLHFVTLVDFGVLKASVLLSLMEHFDGIASKLSPPAQITKQEAEEKPEEAKDSPPAGATKCADGSSDPVASGGTVGSRKPRISVGDTKMRGDLVYEHNMSRRLDRLKIIIDESGKEEVDSK